MLLSTVFWTAVLSQPPASAEPWRPHEAECYRREDAGDYAGAGDACRLAFEAAAEDPLAFDQRSLFAFKAVRLYKRAHAASGDIGQLCSADAVLRAFEAQLATLPAGERTADRADVADGLQSLAPQIAGACSNDPVEELIDVRPRARPPAGRPHTDPPPVLSRRRPLRVAGGIALGAGLGLGAAAIAMMLRAESMDAQVDALNATYPAGVKILEPDWHSYQEIAARGELADRLALGLGLPALGAALSGVVMLSIDGYRERSRRFALSPGPAAIRFLMEF
jgi:hypothetical protein